MSIHSVKVYDLPTRLFHWLFAASFVVAFFIAKVLDDDSPIYAIHMLVGMNLSFIILLRILWGFVGSRYARFSSFELSPKEAIGYFMGILSGERKRWAGHNPASSWAALLMMAMGLGLGITGYLMTSSGDSFFIKEIHEILAHGFLVLVIAHVAGLALHMVRFRDNIGLSMVHGEKQDLDLGTAIPSSHRGVAALFVGLVLFNGFYLWKNFDSASGQLRVFGQTLQLRENENEGEQGAQGSEQSEESEENEAD